MAIAMCLMSEMRCGPKIQKLLLYYPVTNACFDTPSYHQFATDYYLYHAGMLWIKPTPAVLLWMLPLNGLIEKINL